MDTVYHLYCFNRGQIFQHLESSSRFTFTSFLIVFEASPFLIQSLNIKHSSIIITVSLYMTQKTFFFFHFFCCSWKDIDTALAQSLLLIYLGLAGRAPTGCGAERVGSMYMPALPSAAPGCCCSSGVGGRVSGVWGGNSAVLAGDTSGTFVAAVGAGW